MLTNPARSGPDKDLSFYRNALKAIASELEGLKTKHPQLGDFSAAKNTNLDNLSIDYGYRTERSKIKSGWRAGVPAPRSDGIWLHLDFHAASSTAQIHTQPMVGRKLCLKAKVVSYFILEGTATAKIAQSIATLLSQQGVRECKS